MTENAKFLTDTVLSISGVNPKKCMKCGKCSGTCPNYDAMEYHPHEFVSMMEHGNIEKLMRSESIYLCLSCMACVERCPRGVEPGKLVEAVRLMKIRQQGMDRKGPADLPGKFEEDVPQQLLVAAMRKYRK